MCGKSCGIGGQGAVGGVPAEQPTMVAGRAARPGSAEDAGTLLLWSGALATGWNEHVCS